MSRGSAQVSEKEQLVEDEVRRWKATSPAKPPISAAASSSCCSTGADKLVAGKIDRLLAAGERELPAAASNCRAGWSMTSACRSRPRELRTYRDGRAAAGLRRGRAIEIVLNPAPPADARRRPRHVRSRRAQTGRRAE